MAEKINYDESIVPRPGFQEEAIFSPADHTLIGGLAGPGKSWGLCYSTIIDCKDPTTPIYCYLNPRFRFILFRRLQKQTDELIEQASEMYGQLGAKWHGQPHNMFVFPSGAKGIVGSMKDLDDWTNYRGREIHVLGFDEIADFYEIQFMGVLPWNRSTVKGIRPRVIATCNFEGIGYEWVKRYWNIACPCREHKGKNVLFEKSIKIPGMPEVKMSYLFIPGERDHSVLLERDPGYLSRLAIQCGGVDSPRFKALGMGCAEVSKSSFFPEFNDAVHVIPNDFYPKGNWVGVGGHDFATSDMGDAFAFGRILVNEHRDIIVDNELYDWGKDVINQTRLMLPLVDMCDMVVSGSDIFNINQGGEIRCIADQFRIEPPKNDLKEIIFLKSDTDDNTAASIIRSGLQSAREGRQGAIYIRERCTRFIADLKALQTDAKDFEKWVDQRTTIERNGVKHQYHFDVFHAIKTAICRAHSSAMLTKVEKEMSEERTQSIKMAREEAENTIACGYTL